MRTGLLAGITAVSVAAGSLALGTVEAAGDAIRADPTGFGEVPAMSSPAVAEFRATVNREQTEIAYELRYRDFKSPVLEAHVHFGRRATNGGILMFLCSSLDGAPPGTPKCPDNKPGFARVTGTLKAESVREVATQGIAQGDFAEALGAIAERATYVDLHTKDFPTGEIRDQIDPLGFLGLPNDKE
jgi:hypothetical protein